MYEDEILSAMLDEVSGGGDYVEVGAGAGPKKAEMYRQRRNIGRIAPLGFGGIQTINAGATATFTAQVERAAQVLQLLVTTDSTISELNITRLKMGDVDQLLTSEVNAALYGEDALLTRVPDNFSPLSDNATCNIDIRNDGAAAHDVSVSAKAKVNR